MLFNKLNTLKYFIFSFILDPRIILFHKYLFLINVKVPILRLRSVCVSNPTYPSLLSTIETFKAFNCKAVAVKIEIGNLENLPLPFLCQTSNGDLIFLLNIESGRVVFLTEKNNEENLAIEEFSNLWNGIIIYAENLSESEKNGKNVKNGFASIKLYTKYFAYLITSILFIQFVSNLSLEKIPLFFCKVFGILICFTIISFENSSSALNQFCKSIRNGNCDAVLNSKASKLFGVLPLSFIGLFYYTFTIFLLVLNSEFTFILCIISSFLGSLFIPFSIFYQKYKIREWCILCLFVLIEIFIECIIILFFTINYTSKFLFTIENLILLCNTAFISFMIVYTIVFILQNNKKRNEVSKKYNILKYNDNVFNSLIKLGTRHDLDLLKNIGIFYGNQNCSNTLLMVCSPFCEPCAHSHTQLKQLLSNELDLRIQVIFFVADDVNNPYNIATSLLMNSTDNKLNIYLEEWFKSDINTKMQIVENNKENVFKNNVQEKIKIMNEWCFKNDVQHTPTFYLNGYELPNEYDVTDLRFFIEDEESN